MYNYIINIMDTFLLSSITEKINILQSNLNNIRETTQKLITDGAVLGDILTFDGTNWVAAASSDDQGHVKSNWNETDTNSDAFIQNKPLIPSAYNELARLGNTDTSLGAVTVGTAPVNLKAGAKLNGKAIVTTTADTDVSHDLGRAKIGYIGHNDIAAFSHYDLANTTDYALLQSPGGSTVVNAPAGGTVVLKIGGVESGIVYNGTTLQMVNKTITDCSSIECGSGSITNHLHIGPAFTGTQPSEHLFVNGNIRCDGNVTGNNLNIADWNTAFQRPAPQTNNPTFTGTLTTGSLAANTLGANPSIAYIYFTLNDQTGGSKLRFGGGGTASYLCFQNNTLNMKSYSNNGAASLFLNSNGGTVYYGNPPQSLSDDRIKFNEKNIENGLEVIRQLSPEKYIKRLPTQSEGIEEAGFIAQEVLQIPDLSFAVSHPDKEFVEGGDNTQYYALAYSDIFTYGIAGLKELDAIVTKQATIIADLQQRLTELESKISPLC